MSGQLELGLNQASISINKTSARSLVSDSIVALYQIDECYGCPLDRLEFGDGANQTLLVDTKHSIDLELRRIDKQQPLNHNLDDRSRFVCNFAKLSLRSQARYQIDIQEDANSTIIGGARFSCSLQTLNDGGCSSCPLALLFFVILLVTAMERVYALIVSRNKQRAAAANSPRRRPSKLPAPAIVGDNLKQQSVDSEPLAEDDGGGGGNEDDQAESATITEQEAGLTVACHPAEDVNNNTNVIITNSTSTAVSVATVTPPEGATIKRTRIESLDAFRGLTIAGMIMVNYGGAGYKLLEHRPWDGLTPADLVFPSFVFSMGASIALSNKSLSKQGKSLQNMLVKILRRATILMLLGLCLNSKWLDIQTQGLDELRLTGVLQRFSVSYFIVASMYAIKLSVIKWIKAQSLYRVPFVTRLVGIIFEYMTALNYLAIYIYVTFFLYYSDSCPAGYLGPGGMTENGIYANCTGGAAAWLDRAVLGTKHLYVDRQLMEVFKTKVTHDPEGLLGNTTSVLLTFVGLQCGKILGRTKPRCSTHRARVRSFLGWQLILALISISAIYIPINKRLWSLSFVSVSAIFAFATMTILYILMDVYECHRTFLLKLLISAGKNPIFLYVGHSICAGMLPWQFHVDESSHLQLLLRLCWSTFCWLLIAHYMAYKRLFIRV